MPDNTNNDNNLTLEEELAKIKGEQAARIAELEKKLNERDAMIKKILHQRRRRENGRIGRRR